MAVVGLEQTFYSISEDGGAVEMCVVVHFPDIDCPIKFPFTVLLSTRDFSASTVEPLNKGHLGTQAAVPYSEVVPYWEVRYKAVILCTFTASMMYKTYYNDPECNRNIVRSNKKQTVVV